MTYNADDDGGRMKKKWKKHRHTHTRCQPETINNY